MKIPEILVWLILLSWIHAGGQSIDFRFDANIDGVAIQLDSVRVVNITQLCDTVLIYPDTILTMMYDATEEYSQPENTFRVYPCFPNPAREKSNIQLFNPGLEEVSLLVSDIYGRIVCSEKRQLKGGLHNFSFYTGPSHVYIFSAFAGRYKASIKILNVNRSQAGSERLEYLGREDQHTSQKSVMANRPFVYYVDDKLLFKGFAGGLESGFIDKPGESRDYHFQFAVNIPCPGMPEVVYGGQVYNTIQVFSQCWLKENLNIGTRIDGYYVQSDNGLIEKYCYQDDTMNCNKYGGLYFWKEMMQYTRQEGSQGICPPGWHVPSDDDWKVLEGAVDSVYGIGDSIWDISWFQRGYDAGYRLKSTTGWWQGGNGIDSYGFTALPAGLRWFNSNYNDKDAYGYWWTSTEHTYSTAWYRLMYYYESKVYRNGDFRKITGLSVRCLRNITY